MLREAVVVMVVAEGWGVACQLHVFVVCPRLHHTVPPTMVHHTAYHREMESWNKDKCRGWVGFSVKMAHRITAGCDLLLMPSRFEPCGLNQLYAMAYGTVPIVHHVGGLRDTVTQFNPYDNTGTVLVRGMVVVGTW